MPFEPQLPSPYQYLFHGHIHTEVKDPHGTEPQVILSLTDEWMLVVEWQVHGLFVPSIGGKWLVDAYLESIGPADFEDLVVHREVTMTGGTDYRLEMRIPARTPIPGGKSITPGAYKLVTVITALNLFGRPAPFAGYEEGPILQFFEGPSLPPYPPVP